ncbi:MAG: phospholipase A [Desulfobacteraceae bacterium]|nr:phospholipase A [Desulfobacteraceae bacterium]
MKKTVTILWASLILTLISFPLQVCAQEISDYQQCLIESTKKADGNLTLNQVRQRCLLEQYQPEPMQSAEISTQEPYEISQDPVANRLKLVQHQPEPNQDTEISTEGPYEISQDPVANRLKRDKQNKNQPFTLMVHKPNYFMPFSYNASGIDSTLFQEQFDNPNLAIDDIEAQFQISIKTPLAVGLLKDKVDLYAAYTNQSFWQVYNDASAPFREINHEPELWLQVRNDWRFFGFNNKLNMIGIVHQSNGRSKVLSRGWNRIFANFIFSRNNLALSFKPWYRISESIRFDDNPDITDYFGHYELSATYKYGNHSFYVMSRNNIESFFSKGALKICWSFPLGSYPYVKGYIQYFNGYGENLIDYNQHSNTVGIGILLTDFL